MGFSLVEVMVAVALMAVIIIALMTTFNQIQKAFRSSVNQSDVLEGGASAITLLRRELAELTATRGHFSVGTNTDFGETNLYSSEDSRFVFADAGQPQRTNEVQHVYFLSRLNDEWIGTGYYVLTNVGGAGALHRFRQLATNDFDIADLFQRFQIARRSDQNLTRNGMTATNSSRVLDGVTHLKLIPYDGAGSNALLRPAGALFVSGRSFAYTDHFLPASLDVELGIVEAKTYERFVAMRTTPVAATNFLAAQLGRVHLFRQRVPISSVP